MCPTDEFGHIQDRLFRLYCLANIPYEFMTIPWECYPYPDLKEHVDFWVDNYERMRREGMGFELWGTHGNGKTWTATHMLMEVVKQGYSGWFIQFNELKGLYEREDDEKHFNLRKIRESEVLVIDEVTEPWSPAMQEFYAEKLEDALRFRAHRNFPTIITTNLTDAQWKTYYPRVYSQLSGKQLRVHFTGQDFRSKAADEAYERILNGERRPVV